MSDETTNNLPEDNTGDHSAYMPKENAVNPSESQEVNHGREDAPQYGFERESKELLWVAQKVNEVRNVLSDYVIGQTQMVDLLMIGVFSNGHILLEGVPGVAKTLSAKVLSHSLNVGFSRIQFTPDMMPSDVLGTSVYNMKDSSFSFKKGPIFSNIVLIDEINRAPAKTQAALFEVMEERQITYDSVCYEMEFPFLVIATQNPIEQEGTYPLPEAQVDRFMMKVNLGYPSKEEEKQIVRANISETGLHHAQKVLSTDEIMKLRSLVRRVYVDEKIEQYIIDIIFATRQVDSIGLNELSGLITFGASPRGSINLALAAKAYAFLQGRSKK